jgi:hypothetical protein
MIVVGVDAKVHHWARLKAVELGVLNNSIENGDGNIAGFIGDAVIAGYTGAKIVHTYHYDLLLNGRVRIDVKTKRTTVRPREDYECSVADFNTSQECDLYAFVRVLIPSYDMAWILGCMPKDEFYRAARFLKKGTVDGSNKFTVKADCYNIAIADLLELPPKEDA